MTSAALCNRVYNHLREIAARGEPVPVKRQLAEQLNLGVCTIDDAIRALCDAGKLKEDTVSMALAIRRYYVTEIDRWTGYSGRNYKPKAHAVRRPCITGCGRIINSEGAHHRMCTPCRTRDTSSLAPRGGVAPTRRTAPHLT